MSHLTPLNKRRSWLDTVKAIRSPSFQTVSADQGPALSVLVTGGAGFIGSNLCRTLLDQGRKVFAVDNFSTGRRENIEPLLFNENFKFFKLDVCSPDFIEQFSKIHIDQVFHLACPTGVPNIAVMGEEMLLTCSIGTKHALEVAQQHQARFLLTSSAEIYGDPLEFPQRELYTGNVSPTGPRSAYEEGKRFAESLVMTVSKKYGLSAKIVRIFNTYGPGMSLDDQRLIPQFMNSILRNTPFRIYGDGQQTRAHLFISDLISGLLIVNELGQAGEVYNVGADKQTTIRELADNFMSVFGRQFEIEHLPHFIEDHRGRLPAIEKVTELGWRQMIELEAGLKLMAESYGLIQPTPSAVLASDLISVS